MVKFSICDKFLLVTAVYHEVLKSQMGNKTMRKNEKQGKHGKRKGDIKLIRLNFTSILVL